MTKQASGQPCNDAYKNVDKKTRAQERKQVNEEVDKLSGDTECLRRPGECFSDADVLTREDLGEDGAGEEATGEDATGEDATGEGATGEDATGEDATG